MFYVVFSFVAGLNIGIWLRDCFLVVFLLFSVCVFAMGILACNYHIACID